MLYEVITRCGLFDVAAPLHLALRQVLRVGERLLRRDLPGERRRELLADGGRDALELGSYNFV